MKKFLGSCFAVLFVSSSAFAGCIPAEKMKEVRNRGEVLSASVVNQHLVEVIIDSESDLIIVSTSPKTRLSCIAFWIKDWEAIVLPEEKSSL